MHSCPATVLLIEWRTLLGLGGRGRGRGSNGLGGETNPHGSVKALGDAHKVLLLGGLLCAKLRGGERGNAREGWQRIQAHTRETGWDGFLGLTPLKGKNGVAFQEAGKNSGA